MKYLVLLLTVTSLNLFGQSNWVKYPSNPIISAEPGTWEHPKVIPGSVIFYEGNYHMWYTGGNRVPLGGNFLIGHAVSADGISWTKDENNPILTGSEGEWDSLGVWEPSVLLMDEVFHLWYTDAGAHSSLGHATSLDGITWEKDANNPILTTGGEGEWDDDGIFAPSVVHNGSEFQMFYSANGGTEPEFLWANIGLATSVDGISWTKDPNNPILIPGEEGNWDYDEASYPQVVFHDNTYHMWYAGGNFLAWDIGYATSTDGNSWTKSDANPVLQKGPEAFESKMLSMNTVLIDSSVYKMWYRGQNADGGGGIGYARSIPGTTHIAYTLDDQFKVYPNPAGDHINVNSNISGKYTMEISSVNGQQLQRQEVSVNEYQIDLAAFPTGVYFISIRTGEIALQEKFIKL